MSFSASTPWARFLSAAEVADARLAKAKGSVGASDDLDWRGLENG